MSTQQKKILWPVLCVVIVAAAALAFATTRRHGSLSEIELNKAQPPVSSSKAVATNAVVDGSTALPQNPAARGPMQNVRFTLYDVGIQPHEIRAQRGAVSIAIEDRTGDSAGLVIERQNGNDWVQVGHIHRFPNHGRGRGDLRLVPGRYRVSDASQPSHQAALIIEP